MRKDIIQTPEERKDQHNEYCVDKMVIRDHWTCTCGILNPAVKFCGGCGRSRAESEGVCEKCGGKMLVGSTTTNGNGEKKRYRYCTNGCKRR